MRTLSILLVSLLFSAAAIAGGPKVKSITADAEKAVPGETVNITVTLKGNAKDVKSMEFIVREFAYDMPPFALSPVGDKKNRVWEISIPVPYDAPAGNYNLELKVTMEDGSQLSSDDSADNQHGTAGTYSVTVG